MASNQASQSPRSSRVCPAWRQRAGLWSLATVQADGRARSHLLQTRRWTVSCSTKSACGGRSRVWAIRGQVHRTWERRRRFYERPPGDQGRTPMGFSALGQEGARMFGLRWGRSLSHRQQVWDFPGGPVIRNLPMQGTQVRSLVREDFRCHRAAKPCSYWGLHT